MLMRRALTDDKASVGLMFGLTAMFLIGISGFALDYQRALNLRARANAALDAAALASAQKAVELVKVGDTRWKETAEALGHAVFSANFKQNAEIMSLDPKVSVSQSAVVSQFEI